jgi:hypothetical protein
MKKERIAAGVLIILAVIAIALHLSSTDLEFSRYNGGWTGTSGLFADLDARGAQDLASYSELAGREDTLLLLIAPGGSFSPAEAALLKEFLEAGNTVFLADETGASESMLEQVGSSIRVQPVAIASADMEFRDFLSVIAYPRGTDPLLLNVSSLSCNRPSSVEGGVVLVGTTIISWADANQNDHLDENETLSSHGILAREQIGSGTLYVLSDPSIFINGMRGARLSGDNHEFLAHLLSLHPAILVEQTHSMTAGADPVLAAVIWMKHAMIIKISALIGSVLLVAVAFWRRWI